MATESVDGGQSNDEILDQISTSIFRAQAIADLMACANHGKLDDYTLTAAGEAARVEMERVLDAVKRLNLDRQAAAQPIKANA
jgi:hypothetical protein